MTETESPTTPEQPEPTTPEEEQQPQAPEPEQPTEQPAQPAEQTVEKKQQPRKRASSSKKAQPKKPEPETDPDTARYAKIAEKVNKSRAKSRKGNGTGKITDTPRVRRIAELMDEKKGGKAVRVNNIPDPALRAAAQKDRSKLDEEGKALLHDLGTAVRQTPATVACILLALRGKQLP